MENGIVMAKKPIFGWGGLVLVDHGTLGCHGDGQPLETGHLHIFPFCFYLLFARSIRTSSEGAVDVFASGWEGGGSVGGGRVTGGEASGWGSFIEK